MKIAGKRCDLLLALQCWTDEYLYERPVTGYIYAPGLLVRGRAERAFAGLALIELPNAFERPAARNGAQSGGIYEFANFLLP